jgi:hypothetical protein
MAQLTGPSMTAGQPLYSSWDPTTLAPPHAAGEKLQTKDGRAYRYVLAGAADLVAGNCIQSSAQIANHLALTPVAAAVGDKTLTVALGATLATANQYAGGYAIVSTAPGNGNMYKIASHPAAALSTNLVLTLEDPILVAITTTSRIDLEANAYSGVIQTPVTTLTGAVVGVAVFPITAAQWGWIQVRGTAPVLIAGTPAVGQSVSCPATAAGAAAINSGTLAIIGQMKTTGVDGKNNAVFLTLE